jgi:hypothetical protein
VEAFQAISFEILRLASGERELVPMVGIARDGLAPGELIALSDADEP